MYSINTLYIFMTENKNLLCMHTEPQMLCSKSYGPYIFKCCEIFIYNKVSDIISFKVNESKLLIRKSIIVKDCVFLKSATS